MLVRAWPASFNKTFPLALIAGEISFSIHQRGSKSFRSAPSPSAIISPRWSRSASWLKAQT